MLSRHLKSDQSGRWEEAGWEQPAGSHVAKWDQDATLVPTGRPSWYSAAGSSIEELSFDTIIINHTFVGYKHQLLQSEMEQKQLENIQLLI